MAQMIARQRLYLTADKSKLVPAGHKSAAFLYAAEGDQIPDSAAARFGLVDGRLKAGRAAKEDGGGADKERKPGSDKGSKPGGEKPAPSPAPAEGNDGAGGEGTGDPAASDDLVSLKGVGEKTAKALAAAGLTTFAAIAAIDPAAPPKVDGIGAVFKWADVIASAKEKIAATTEG